MGPRPLVSDTLGPPLSLINGLYASNDTHTQEDTHAHIWSRAHAQVHLKICTKQFLHMQPLRIFSSLNYSSHPNSDSDREFLIHWIIPLYSF